MFAAQVVALGMPTLKAPDATAASGSAMGGAGGGAAGAPTQKGSLAEAAKAAGISLKDLAAAGLSMAEPDTDTLDYTYVMTVDCNIASKAVVAASSRNILHVYNADLAQILTMSGHEDTVNVAKFRASEPSTVLSCSSDGTVRLWDCRTGSLAHTIRCPPCKELKSTAVMSTDEGCGGSLIASGIGLSVQFWDPRATGKPLAVYSNSHQDLISDLRFNPSLPTHLLSGAEDGLACVFDVARTGGEDEALQAVVNMGTAIRKVGHFGPSDAYLYCISQVESLGVWNAPTVEPVLRVDLDSLNTAHSIVCGSLVDCHYEADTQTLTLLAAGHEGQGYMFDLEPTGTKLRVALSNGHQSTIRCASWPAGSATSAVFTGGEDGRLVKWCAGTADEYVAAMTASADSTSTADASAADGMFAAEPAARKQYAHALGQVHGHGHGHGHRKGRDHGESKHTGPGKTQKHKGQHRFSPYK